MVALVGRAKMAASVLRFLAFTQQCYHNAISRAPVTAIQSNVSLVKSDAI